MPAVIAEQDLDWLGLVWLFTSVHAAIELVGLLPQLLLHYEPWTGPVLAIWFGLVWLPQVCTLHTPHRTGWYCSSCTVNCGPCPRPVCATCAALLRFGRRLSAGQGDHSQHTTETFPQNQLVCRFHNKGTNQFISERGSDIAAKFYTNELPPLHIASSCPLTGHRPIGHFIWTRHHSHFRVSRHV